MPQDRRDAELIRRYVAYLESPEFRPVSKRLTRAPVWRYVLAFVAFMTTIGIPITLYQIVRILTHRKRWRAETVEWAEGTVAVMACPLMMNASLRRKPGAVAPGLVIGSFATSADVTPGFLAGVAERVLTAGADGDASPDEQEAADLMADVVYTPGRRRRLPPGLTGGHEVYAFDLMIVGEFLLPWNEDQVPLIPCAADPGPEGRIEMIPPVVVKAVLGVYPGG